MNIQSIQFQFFEILYFKIKIMEIKMEGLRLIYLPCNPSYYLFEKDYLNIHSIEIKEAVRLMTMKFNQNIQYR